MGAADPPILLLHGFTQTGASWRPVVEHLPPEWDVRCPDLPGHGARSAVHTNLRTTATLLAHEVDPARPAIVVGYSMGGRLALRLVLDHPEVVAGLVLVSTTAGIDDGGERHARRNADEGLARRIEAYGVAPFLDEWLAQPLFADLVIEPDDLIERLTNSPTGLASSLRLAGTGTMDPPWWDEVAAIEVPTAVVWGERDHKFALLGRRLADAIGANAREVELDGLGHAAHLEDPARVAAVIADLAEAAGATGRSSTEPGR